MIKQNMFLLIAALAVAGLLSCTKQTSATQKHSATPPPGAVRVGRYGSACRGEGVGPVGYLLSDIGKWGVPNPNSDEMALLARIRRYDHSRTLRFAYVGQGPYAPRFVVYDNGNDACSEAPLLNGAPIEYYQPQQPPYVISGPEGGTPYPWSRPTP